MLSSRPTISAVSSNFLIENLVNVDDSERITHARDSDYERSFTSKYTST